MFSFCKRYYMYHAYMYSTSFTEPPCWCKKMYTVIRHNHAIADGLYNSRTEKHCTCISYLLLYCNVVACCYRYRQRNELSDINERIIITQYTERYLDRRSTLQDETDKSSDIYTFTNQQSFSIGQLVL